MGETTQIEIPVFSIKDVPDDTETEYQVKLISSRKEYFTKEQLQGYGIRAFYNRNTRKDIPGLSVMRKGQKEFINVKMDVNTLIDYLVKHQVIKKVTQD
jgi:hypothetical protein